jgi:hypothetical protein
MPSINERIMTRRKGVSRWDVVIDKSSYAPSGWDQPISVSPG